MTSIPLVLEVAKSAERGLMDRESLEPGVDGMIFFSRRPSISPFWNHRTLMPLDVAFVDGRTGAMTVVPMRSIRESRGVVEQVDAPFPYTIVIEVPRGRLPKGRLRLRRIDRRQPGHVLAVVHVG